jgi:protein-glutamine gamma-glutamyltransferase
MSDFMKPGDVASVSQSADVAFRVKFDGEIPPRSTLYWRGLVFSRLDQGIWSALGYYDVPVKEQRPGKVAAIGASLSYSIIMEPTQQNWLYGLHYAHSTTPGVMHTSDYRLFSPVPLEVEFMYTVNTWTDVGVDAVLSDWRRKTETKLPPVGNPETRQMALDLRATASSDEDYVALVLDTFSREGFVYTLRPGMAASNR